MKKILGLASIIAVVVFWGISFVSIDLILDVIDPVVLGFFRYVLAVAFVMIFVIVKRIDLRVPKKDLLIFFLAGLFGIFIYTSLENMSMLYISPQASSIFTTLTPLFIAFGNFIVYRERLRKGYLFYILLSIGGVVLVVSGDLNGSENNPFGYLLMFIAIVSWTGYSLFTKRVTEIYPTAKVTVLQSMMALLIFLPTLFFRPKTDFSLFTAAHWGHLLFLGIVCSGLCYYLYIHSIKTLGLTVPNIFLNFIPVVTIAVNVIFGGEQVEWTQIVGSLLIIATMTALTIDNIRSSRVPSTP